MVEVQNALISDLEYVQEEFDMVVFKVKSNVDIPIGPFHIMIKMDGAEKKIVPVRKLLPNHTQHIRYAPNQRSSGASVTIEVINDCFNELNDIDTDITTIKKTFKYKTGGERNYVGRIKK